MGASTQPPNAVATEANNTPAVPEGVQKRIDELTAKNGEFERKYSELQLKYENMANGVAASLGVNPQPNQPQIDPGLQAAINAALGPVVNELRNLRQGAQSRALQETFQQTRAPDAVTKRAQELYDEYARKGVILQPDIVRRQAWGEIAEQEHLKSVAANQQRGNFNMPYANMGNGASTSLSAPVTAERPQNFDSLNAREQVAWYEKNVGNKPL